MITPISMPCRFQDTCHHSTCYPDYKLPLPDSKHLGAGSLPNAPLQPQDQAWDEQIDLCDKIMKTGNLTI